MSNWEWVDVVAVGAIIVSILAMSVSYWMTA